MHTCSAIVVTCIDFRLQKYIEAWLTKHVGDHQYDRVAWAGGVIDLPGIIKQIEISSRLHHIKKVVLINHEDCGAYEVSGSPEKHARDLRNAKKEVEIKFPNLNVDTYYLHLDGTFEAI